jgi:hypothetical protein
MTTTETTALAREVRALADSLARRAEELRAYADGVTAERDVIAAGLGNVWTGPGYAEQLRARVAEPLNTRPGTDYAFHRALFAALAAEQRSNVTEETAS